MGTVKERRHTISAAMEENRCLENKDCVDFGYELGCAAEDLDDAFPMRDVVVGKGAVLAVLEPFLEWLVAADILVEYLLLHAREAG